MRSHWGRKPEEGNEDILEGAGLGQNEAEVYSVKITEDEKGDVHIVIPKGYKWAEYAIIRAIADLGVMISDLRPIFQKPPVSE